MPVDGAHSLGSARPPYVLQPMTPRQMRLVAGPADVCNQGGQTMLREEEAPYAFDSKDARRAQKARLQRYLALMKDEGLDATGASSVPGWQSKIVKGTPERCATSDNSTIIDSSFAQGACCACAGCPRCRPPNGTPGPCLACVCRPCAGARCRLADAELRKVWEQLEEKYKLPVN